MAAAASPPLAGRAAFVTGAAQGLGAAIARALAEAGAAVALADTHAEGAVAQADTLAAEGHAAIGLALDVRDEAAFTRAVDTAAARLAGLAGTGGIGILVNNAALTRATPLWDIDAAEWDALMAVNLRGAFFGCRVAARHMIAHGQSGRILNLASLAGQQASPASGVHYAASKAGVLALTRGFAAELAPHRITVNALAPAAVRSPALDALAPPRREALAGSIPLGRFGEPWEVGAAAVFLAGEAGGFITGATLDMNGGRLMR